MNIYPWNKPSLQSHKFINHLLSPLISFNIHFSIMVRALNIRTTLSKFKYIIQYLSCITKTLYPLIETSPFPPPPHPLVTTILLSGSMSWLLKFFNYPNGTTGILVEVANLLPYHITKIFFSFRSCLKVKFLSEKKNRYVSLWFSFTVHTICSFFSNVDLLISDSGYISISKYPCFLNDVLY